MLNQPLPPFKFTKSDPNRAPQRLTNNAESTFTKARDQDNKEHGACLSVSFIHNRSVGNTTRKTALLAPECGPNDIYTKM